MLPMQELARQAIQSALACNWSAARKLNLQILKEDPENIDALNRLSKAYFELGNTQKALQTCRRVLEIDSLNTIAVKNFGKFNSLKPSLPTSNTKQIDPGVFLEQPGKTRIVELIHVSDNTPVADLSPGSQVRLHTGGFRVSVFSLTGQYIGKITDDVSRKVIDDTNNNLHYEAWIKDSQPGKIVVFLKPNTT